MLRNRWNAVLPYKEMKIKTLVICFIVLAVFAVPAYAGTVSDALQQAIKSGVPSDQASSLVARARAAGVQDKAITEMLEVVVRAKKDDVPAGVVTGKILEGISKHVAPRLIVDTAGRLERSYVTANTIYGEMNRKGHAGNELKQAIAIAVFNGITKDELKDLYHAAPRAGESYYIMGTVSLTSLVSSGFGKDQSLSFMKKEFAGHKTIDEIQHKTMELMEQPPDNRTIMMDQGMERGNSMEMNRPHMPANHSEGMPMNQNMNMHNQRN